MYAFVLKRMDWRESDQLIVFYTWEKGKTEAIARGIKKITSKNSAYLSSFFLLDVELIPSKEKYLFTKAVPFACYKNILKDSSRMMMLSMVLNWVDCLTQTGERDKRIFLLLKHWIEYLDEVEAVSDSYLYAFLGRLMVRLGFAPVFNECCVCYGEQNLTGFFPKGGGVICKKCLLEKKQAGEKVYSLRQSDWQFLKLLFAGRWSKLGAGNEVANRLVFLYAQYHSEKKLAKLRVF